MNMNSYDKVAERREQKIKEAAAEADWDEVQRLLNQPYENAERKDRYHGKVSLDYHYSDDKTTLYDFVSHGKDALEVILEKEAIEKIHEAIASLPEIEQKIISEIDFSGMRPTEVAKKLALADSTISRKHKKVLEKLELLLEEYFRN